MALRKILLCGDPVLRKKAAKVVEVDDRIRELLDDMVETMVDAPGIGLAAPQVGEPIRCLVARDCATEEGEEDRIYKIINPRLRGRGGTQTAFEGCLSLPTLHGEVKRPEWVAVAGLDENGKEIKVEAEGLLARCLLHEMDHLDGILFLDRCEAGSLAWTIPDDREEDGYRLEETTVDEVNAAFDRLRQRQAAKEQQP